MGELPATFVFHGDLRDLLGRGKAGADGRVTYPVTRRTSVKDAIEALGPPHTEVGTMEVDGLAVSFGHLLEPGRRIDVQPVPAPFDVLRPSPLRPEPLPRIAFLVDANVGRLAGLLRALGFDTAYDPSLGDAALAEQAAREGRILLSRDRLLLRRGIVVYGRLIRSRDPETQLLEVLRFFGLRPPFATFTRCLRCNDPLQTVSKAEIMDRLLPLTKLHYTDFRRCPRCNRIYWAGSHHERMHERVGRICRELGGGETEVD
ncbi:Mut7-C RNAse domain-containing protein [Desulfomicrobium salsuginis]